jgi:hypothetical protein
MAFKMTGKSPMIKALKGKQYNLPEELKAKIEASPLNKGWEDRVRKKKGGNVANVTDRIGEGNKKGAKLTQRMNKASSKGNKSKADRLERKRDTADNKHWSTLSTDEQQKRNKNNAGRQKFTF